MPSTARGGGRLTRERRAGRLRNRRLVAIGYARIGSLLERVVGFHSQRMISRKLVYNISSEVGCT